MRNLKRVDIDVCVCVCVCVCVHRAAIREAQGGSHCSLEVARYHSLRADVRNSDDVITPKAADSAHNLYHAQHKDHFHHRHHHHAGDVEVEVAGASSRSGGGGGDGGGGGNDLQKTAV